MVDTNSIKIPTDSRSIDISDFMTQAIMDQILLCEDGKVSIMTDRSMFNPNADMEKEYGFTNIDKYIVIAKTESAYKINSVSEDDIEAATTCQDLIDIVLCNNIQAKPADLVDAQDPKKILSEREDASSSDIDTSMQQDRGEMSSVQLMDGIACYKVPIEEEQSSKESE